MYKGSPKLGLNKKPAWFIASVTLGTGAGLAALAAFFFVPYIHAKVIRRDPSVKLWMMLQGPMLFRRPAPSEDNLAPIPKYAVVQDESDDESLSSSVHSMDFTGEKDGRVGEKAVDTPEDARSVAAIELGARSRDDIMAIGEAKLRAQLLEKRGPMGWAMRTLRDNPMGPGRIYEFHNMKIALVRLPAVITSGLLYGMYYDIHAAQSGIEGTPEGERMKRVYAHAKKYPDEVEHTYSFVQILTACTASFAHGANDIGNAVGPWAVIYSAWHTGNATAAKASVPIWQLAVLAIVLCIGFITYGEFLPSAVDLARANARRQGYNIMRVMGNKITYHSPSRGASMEMGAAITVLVFSQYSLPVSTSMCITGATVGVGLMNGTFKAVNFQRVGLLLFSWIMTIPIAGTLAGVLMGIVLNAPHFARR